MSADKKVVDLTFLTEVEEHNFRTTVNDDLQLQRAEELRLKSAIRLSSCINCVLFVILQAAAR